MSNRQSEALANFRGLEGKNLIDLEPDLDRLTGGRLSPSFRESLNDWGRKILGPWDALAREASRSEKLPRIEQEDRVSNPVARVVLPLETQTLRREVVEMGVWKTRNFTEKFLMTYLLSHMGESSLTCPLACTDGLLRAMTDLASPEVKKKYLPLLTSAEFPVAGAQFITEKAGGSDVGAIEMVAKHQSADQWKLTGEKWYCSAITDFFLLAARPEGAPEGTDGVAIFFVPRMLDGKPNGLAIKRLKNKLGTQSLPTAEVDFTDAVGFILGKPEDGFHHLMDYILNTSRVHNAAAALGLVHRAYLEAKNYAEQRICFGRPIVEFPMVKESLDALNKDHAAKKALYFSMLGQIDKHGWVPADREQRLWQRFLINLLKYRTAACATVQVKEAILILGANGIIEDFTILPRLFRDALIVETWEGTHNVLALQIVRDGARFDFLGRLKKELAGVSQLSSVLTGVTPGRLSDPNWAAVNARHFIDTIGSLLEAQALGKN